LECIQEFASFSQKQRSQQKDEIEFLEGVISQ
jgi:hypothetical protein